MLAKDISLKNYLTIEETAIYLDVCPATIFEYLKSGELKAFRKGRVVRISKENLERFISNNPFSVMSSLGLRKGELEGIIWDDVSPSEEDNEKEL